HGPPWPTCTHGCCSATATGNASSGACARNLPRMSRPCTLRPGPPRPRHRATTMVEAKATRWTIPALLVTLAATALLYVPGLYGGYVHDDFGFIVHNGDVQVTRL